MPEPVSLDAPPADPPPPRQVSAEEWVLVQRLRSGEETAFSTLVQRYQRSMIRLAAAHTPSQAVAEEVVQEAWIGILNGIDGFEGRCPLRAWMFRIVANTAKLRGTREARSTPFSALEDDEGPSVSADSFRPDDDPRWAGHWTWNSAPTPWPDEQLASQQTMALVKAQLEQLPPRQREVMTLRDIEGWTSAEVCESLGLSEENQRVLLHRARSKVRLGLSGHLAGNEVKR
jgi:RNA polymerase sigma-70 factor, ECF subfamily